MTKFDRLNLVEETPQGIVLKHKWNGSLWYSIVLIVAAILLNRLLVFGEYDKELIWAYLLGFILLYWGLCGVFNTITIKITKEFVEIKQNGLPFLFNNNMKILMKDIDNVVIETDYELRNSKRKFDEIAIAIDIVVDMVLNSEGDKYHLELQYDKETNKYIYGRRIMGYKLIINLKNKDTHTIFETQERTNEVDKNSQKEILEKSGINFLKSKIEEFVPKGE
jgi:hypothetical protein